MTSTLPWDEPPTSASFLALPAVGGKEEQEEV
jgi:hypothetical protein